MNRKVAVQRRIPNPHKVGGCVVEEVPNTIYLVILVVGYYLLLPSTTFPNEQGNLAIYDGVIAKRRVSSSSRGNESHFLIAGYKGIGWKDKPPKLIPPPEGIYHFVEYRVQVFTCNLLLSVFIDFLIYVRFENLIVCHFLNCLFLLMYLRASL